MPTPRVNPTTPALSAQEDLILNPEQERILIKHLLLNIRPWPESHTDYDEWCAVTFELSGTAQEFMRRKNRDGNLRQCPMVNKLSTVFMPEEAFSFCKALLAEPGFVGMFATTRVFHRCNMSTQLIAALKPPGNKPDRGWFKLKAKPDARTSEWSEDFASYDNIRRLIKEGKLP